MVVKSEFLIIGGGVIGLSIARALHKRGGRSITVVDKGIIGAEASWAAAGMLAPNAETHRADAFFRFCIESNALYSSFAEDLLDETGIDIDLDRRGTLCLAFNEPEEQAIREKFEWQRNAAIEVESLSAEDILKLEPDVSPSVRSGLFYPNDWQVENRKLVAALQRYAELNGVSLIENTAVAELSVEGERIIGAHTAKGEILAGTTIVTAGAWTSQLSSSKPKFAGQIRPIRGQMIGFQAPERLLNCVIYGPRGYIVPRADGRLLVGATVEDVGFHKEVTAEAIAELRAAASEIARVIGGLDIKEAWAGLRPCASDELPVIGRPGGIEGLMVATGHYRNGILLAPITANIVADEIASGIVSKYFGVFSPDRFVKADTATP